MSNSPQNPPRVRTDGKFFRLGPWKFHVKGVTYGPFAPDANGETYPSRDQAKRDLLQIRELQANVLRLYHGPPRWFLDLAAEHELRCLIDIPWAKHLCFLDTQRSRHEARKAVRRTVTESAGHPAVFAYSVVNEICADIVRWSGVRRVQQFIDELVDEAKGADPGCLCTFSSFPPTEFLEPGGVDFLCFNVYLHQPKPFEAYLARLQTIAGGRPLVLGEFGMDAIREGEDRQAEFLTWQIELACRSGLAGTVVFSFTDDWFRGGMQIEDWGFGLTSRERLPKKAFHAVQSRYRVAPYFPLPSNPRVSVVVASYNGGRTLEHCLQSLTQLNYPDYETILVDDGSTDNTPEIGQRFPTVRYVRQENRGLSAARNTGILAATGEIVAFTDDDCRTDEDWLHYLVSDLVRGEFAGIGGHNFLPPEDSCVAAAVLVSPGGPTHVMLTDREAEHIPGCNMAFYKRALEGIGLFDPVFRKAGDDVDICWRLQDAGHRIGFSPAGFVWHYRRSTVKAYLKQQAGYGEAEALLTEKHPEHFSALGGGIWRGRIYAAASSGILLRRAVVYHGVFGSAFFQRLYVPHPVPAFLYCTALGYHLLVNLPLLLLAVYLEPFVPIAIASLTLSLGTSALAAAQAQLPRHKERFWSRPLVGLLFFLQPIVRGWARFKWKLRPVRQREAARADWPAVLPAEEVPEAVTYWSEPGGDRYRFLHGILGRLSLTAWEIAPDSGWTSYDVEVFPSFWTQLRLTTVCEELELGRRNFRCRMEGLWSLPAKVLLMLLTLGLAALIMSFADRAQWVWLSLITFPLVCWWIEDELRTHKQQLAALIDTVAAEQALVKIDPALSGP